MNELQLDGLAGAEAAKTAATSPVAGLRRELSPIHFSSQSNEWGTPQWFFDSLHREFQFTLDPCSTHQNAKCQRHYTIAENGLAQDWSGEVVFMNPPYGREIAQWMQKAFISSQEGGATVVCLVPARTDTVWWHSFAMPGEIRFLKGRLKFGDATNSAPFPSALVILRPGAFRAGSPIALPRDSALIPVLARAS